MPDRKLLNFDEPIIGVRGITVGDFWRWAYSDVLSNRNRAIFAEFIVGVALDCVAGSRNEWSSADLQYRGYAIEVKCAAYCQAWTQQRPSPIRFSIRKATRWDEETGQFVGQPERCSDLYVFCVYTERESSAANVLNVAAWDFYVVPTSTINEELGVGQTVALSRIVPLAVRCGHTGLRRVVDDVIDAFTQRVAHAAG